METTSHPRRRALASVACLLGAVGLTALVAVAEALGLGSSGLGASDVAALALAGVLAAAAFRLASPRARVRAAVSLGTVLVLLVAAELALRTDLGLRWEALCRADARYLHTLVPGARKRLEGDLGPLVVSVDACGHRGGHAARPAGPRVAVFGDSFIQAESTPDEETFVERLRIELERGLSRSVDAVNAGVVAYGPDQCLLRMEDELPVLAPDLVVFSVFAGNDHGDLVRNRLFHLDESGALVRTAPGLARNVLDDFARAHEPLRLARVARRMLRPRGPGHASPRDESRALLGVCLEEHDVSAADPAAPVANLFWDHVDEDLRLLPHGVSARGKRALMDAVLREVRDTAARHGVPLLVLVVPEVQDVRAERAAHLAEAADYRPDNLTRPLAESAAAAGIASVDLFEPFSSAGGDRLYAGDDPHWNAAGQALAARLVAERVLAEGWLE